MYHGKYTEPVGKARRKRRPGILIISLVLLLGIAVGGTVALLLDFSDAVENTFTPAKVKITINEETTPTSKSGITFTNPEADDAFPVYIRATLVIYWEDLIDGKVQTVAQPADCSVEVGGLLDNGWFQVDEIYYYESAVNPGDTTAVMTDVIKVTIPEGSTAKCYIDVRAEAIQADPDTAVEEAWGGDVSVVDGKLKAAAAG